jgi:hypothetical protein
MADNETGASRGGESDSLLGALASGVLRLARRAPGTALDLAQKSFDTAERYALSTLRKRMDAVAARETGLQETSPSQEPVLMPRPGQTTREAPPTAVATMAQLLEASLEQTPESAREALALRLVKQLVPDEARILAALADGHSAALVHLGAGPLVGPASQRWLENLSPVGKEAGVQLADQTPHYVSHLRDLGLLEAGEEDKSLQLKYQLIEADTLVRRTCEQIEKSGLRPRFFRRTLRMSDAGRAFWSACEAIENKSW